MIQSSVVQLLTLIVSQTNIEKVSFEKTGLSLKVQDVYMMFEKNTKTEPMVSIMCCGLMEALMKQDKQNLTFIMQKFSQPNSL